MKNTIFAECSLLPCQRTPTPQNFAEKTFVNSHKTTKFEKVFSLESFPLYGIDNKNTAVIRNQTQRWVMPVLYTITRQSLHILLPTHITKSVTETRWWKHCFGYRFLPTSMNMENSTHTELVWMSNQWTIDIMKTIAYTSHYSRAAFVSLRAPNCAATIQGQCLFHSELPIVRLLYIQGWQLFEGGKEMCTAHDTFQPRSHFISNTGVVRRWRRPSHAENAVRWMKVAESSLRWNTTWYRVIGLPVPASMDGIWGLVCYKSKGTSH